jgi:hypothetical protein
MRVGPTPRSWLVLMASGTAILKFREPQLVATHPHEHYR